jgi:hypothetical protein
MYGVMQMPKEPTIGQFLDEEERALYEAIEADDSAFKSVLTPAERERHRAIAKVTLDDERIQNQPAHFETQSLKAESPRTAGGHVEKHGLLSDPRQIKWLTMYIK